MDDNEIVALVGSNGAGKSSILKAIMGMVPPSGGSIIFNGETISGMPTYDVVRHRIGFSPEGRRVFRELSVLENLRAGAHTLDRRRMRERLDQIYTYFPLLKERTNQFAGSLSGGEQQMLAVGRALMMCPRLLLLDEPSLGLAPVMTQRIGELIKAIQATERLAVLLAEQNSNWALKIADRGLVIELGRLVLTGSSTMLLSDDHVRSAYLGT